MLILSFEPLGVLKSLSSFLLILTNILSQVPDVMASATGIPEHRVATSGEDEPLLGRPGDASQQEGQGLQYNFVIGKNRI